MPLKYKNYVIGGNDYNSVLKKCLFKKSDKNSANPLQTDRDLVDLNR